MSYEKFDLNLLGGGAAVSQVNHWVGEAIKDCLDPNKERDKTRTVILKIKLSCSSDGEKVVAEYFVETKFPSDAPGQDMLAVHRATKQAYINTDEQIEIPFDPDTGEITEMRTEMRNTK